MGQSAGRYETGAGQILAGDWRHETGRNLAVALYRWDRMIEGLSEREVAAVDDFYRNRLDAGERAAVLRRLGVLYFSFSVILINFVLLNMVNFFVPTRPGPSSGRHHRGAFLAAAITLPGVGEKRSPFTSHGSFHRMRP